MATHATSLNQQAVNDRTLSKAKSKEEKKKQFYFITGLVLLAGFLYLGASLLYHTYLSL